MSVAEILKEHKPNFLGKKYKIEKYCSPSFKMTESHFWTVFLKLVNTVKKLAINPIQIRKFIYFKKIKKE